MNLDDLSPFALQRVVAHDGLAIDAATWTDAHTYHQTAQRFHTRALHGYGIVRGLRVVATDPPSRAVIVQPGVAIDHDGNTIRVPQPLNVAVQQGAKNTLCVVLRFADVPADSGASAASNRLAEGYQMLTAAPPLSPQEIELARIEIGDAKAPFRPAGDEWAPESGEIDGRFRRELRPQTIDTLTIGQLALIDPSANGMHRQGLINVVRGLRAAAPFVAHFSGDVSAEQAAGQCDLLYISGAGEWRPTPREAAHVITFLRGGGLVFAEPCVDQEAQKKESGRFVSSFQRLLTDLKFGLEELTPSHPLFRARHVFGLPAEGVGGHASILGRSNVILNPNDYGCCWQGGARGKPLARGAIREAMEFATNVAWYTADRVYNGLSG